MVVSLISWLTLNSASEAESIFTRGKFKVYAFLAFESLIKLIPRLLGPNWNKAGKLPRLLSHKEYMLAKIEQVNSTIKFQMNKFLNLSVTVGHVNMKQDQVFDQFLFFLLSKNWENVQSLHINSLMGPPQRLSV